MRTPIALADLRVRLAVRLAVAPRQWFKRLWEPNARPHERDTTREELVAFITHDWDCLEIDATAPEIVKPRDPSWRGDAGLIPPDGPHASPPRLTE